jgi:type VI secretion system secreted protein VgrG
MIKPNYLKLLIILVALITVAAAGGPTIVGALGQARGVGGPTLGTAESFAVLAGSTATNTGSTVVTGNLGVWPGTEVTGFPPGIVVGTTYPGGAVAQQAQSDVTTAYNNLVGLPCDTDLSGTDLGGLVLVEGVYCFSDSAQLTGQLTLDAQGSATAVFVFQIGSSLTTAANASVLLTNSGSECNVFWQVGSSATLGTSTAFAGNILALTSTTLNTNADVSGRTLARNGAVTMDTNDISMANCVAGPTPTATNTATPIATATPTATATNTATPTATATTTATPIATATNTATPIATATNTPLPPTNVDLSSFGSGSSPGTAMSPWLLLLLAPLGLAWWMWRNKRPAAAGSPPGGGE